MRKKRNENIRNTLKEMDILLIGMIVFYNINEKSCPFIYNLRKLTHRIKRATWRGEKKSKGIYRFSETNALAKRITTNQTTTANIDVSTIPYY